MQNGRDTEPLRRFGAIVLQWGGWLTNIGVFVYATLEFNPAHGSFAPQWVGFAFILSMGLGIAGTLVRSRMRLTNLIIHAFKTGSQIERETIEREQAERDKLERKD